MVPVFTVNIQRAVLCNNTYGRDFSRPNERLLTGLEDKETGTKGRESKTFITFTCDSRSVDRNPGPIGKSLYEALVISKEQEVTQVYQRKCKLVRRE